ncbi:MAG: IS91 family transposase [Desulfobacterales bacterium]|nr:IS91 family transposase [Desulfobacterales bacterium]
MHQTAKVKNRNIVCIGRPSFEVADILREYIGSYQETFPLLSDHYKIVHNLLSCRTADLGGHIERCDHCGTERISYNSCRNRHCPKCQNMPRERWLDARKAELLPVPYYHNVFTLPHDLNPIILFNKKIMLNILFKAVSQTLLAFGENPKNKLAGKLGFIAILHTWDQHLNAHFHLHCLIPGGVLKTDGSWQPTKHAYLFNVEALSQAFRGKFLDYMTKAYQDGKLKFPGISSPFERPERFKQLKESLYSKKWVVYIQKPIKRPEYVLEYLGRYTHRVAISNHRIVSVRDGMVTFKYKNRDTKKTMFSTITAVEFIRRFLLHTLSKGFVRIRHFGFLSNRHKTDNIKKIRKFLGRSAEGDKIIKQSIEEMMFKLTGIDITLCPCCKKGKMRVVFEIPKNTHPSIAEIIRPPNLRKAA